MSTLKTSSSVLSLRELHLTPHFIYMVERTTFEPNKEYGLQIWKDDMKIGVETDMLKNDTNGSRKHAYLQFQKIRIVFDVESLFQEKSEAEIVLKLAEKDLQQEKQTILDEFHLHILYYNYEFSKKDRFVKHKQNNVGKISNFILNYSFSAIYGETTDSLLFRKHQKKKSSVLLQDLKLAKKDSKYGLIVKDEQRTSLDTIFMIQTVAQKGMNEMKNSIINLLGKEQDNPESAHQKYSVQKPEQDGLQNARKATRSILDDVAIENDDSSITEYDLLEELKIKANNISAMFIIFVSSVLIYILMHPNRKI